MDRAIQLADEIKQIAEQYKKEVSTSRRAWPLSIRERVIELRRLGMSCARVSQMTQIPEPTVWVWTSKKGRGQKRDEPQFISVDITSTVKDLTVKSPIIRSINEHKPTFQVELPGGLRIQNIDLESLVELSKRMSK